MFYEYIVHCDKCNINLTIELSKKLNRKPRCRLCGRILKDGHITEDKREEVEKEDLKKIPRTKKSTNRKSTKTKAKSKKT